VKRERECVCMCVSGVLENNNKKSQMPNEQCSLKINK
jgi:hypothetical protein